VGGTLGEAATLLDKVPASVPQPAAAVRFGPDGRLYVAFEQALDAPSSEGAFNGRVLRLNPDGTTPRDQRGGSPVFASGARRPRGFDWDPVGALWIVDGDVLRTERLIGVQPDPAPRAPLVSLALPVPFGAASAVFHPTGDLLIGAEIGGYVLRIHFDPANRQRVLGTERLLEGEVDAVRAIAVTPDGSVYVCTNATLMILRPQTR
jgi:glucose/arabinose dehydrogenase